MTIKRLIELLQKLSADYGDDIPVDIPIRISDGDDVYEVIKHYLFADDKLILRGEYDNEI